MLGHRDNVKKEKLFKPIGTNVKYLEISTIPGSTWFHSLETPGITERENWDFLGICCWTVTGCIRVETFAGISGVTRGKAPRDKGHGKIIIKIIEVTESSTRSVMRGESRRVNSKNSPQDWASLERHR